MNNFNDKFFLLLWYWMALLICMFSVTFAGHFLELAFFKVRIDTLLKCVNLGPRARRNRRSVKDYLAHSKLKHELIDMMMDLQRSDWFVLTMVAKNLDRVVFHNLLVRIIVKYRSMMFKMSEDEPKETRCQEERGEDTCLLLEADSTALGESCPSGNCSASNAATAPPLMGNGASRQNHQHRAPSIIVSMLEDGNHDQEEEE